MADPQTHLDVINLWPSKAEFARAIGVRPNNARNMATTGIPAKYWETVVEAVARAGFPPVTYAMLRAAGLQDSQPRKDT